MLRTLEPDPRASALGLGTRNVLSRVQVGYHYDGYFGSTCRLLVLTSARYLIKTLLGTYMKSKGRMVT